MTQSVSTVGPDGKMTVAWSTRMKSIYETDFRRSAGEISTRRDITFRYKAHWHGLNVRIVITVTGEPADVKGYVTSLDILAITLD